MVSSLLILGEEVDWELGLSASHGCRCGGGGDGDGGTVSMSKNNYIVALSAYAHWRHDINGLPFAVSPQPSSTLFANSKLVSLASPRRTSLSQRVSLAWITATAAADEHNFSNVPVLANLGPIIHHALNDGLLTTSESCFAASL